MNAEKTGGQGNRRGVSFHLILQILPERYRTSSDGKAGHGRGKEKKRSARTATTIMMLSLRGKSPSPERKVHPVYRVSD